MYIFTYSLWTIKPAIIFTNTFLVRLCDNLHILAYCDILHLLWHHTVILQTTQIFYTLLKTTLYVDCSFCYSPISIFSLENPYYAVLPHIMYLYRAIKLLSSLIWSLRYKWLFSIIPELDISHPVCNPVSINHLYKANLYRMYHIWWRQR